MSIFRNEDPQWKDGKFYVLERGGGRQNVIAGGLKLMDAYKLYEENTLDRIILQRVEEVTLIAK